LEQTLKQIAPNWKQTFGGKKKCKKTAFFTDLGDVAN